MRTFVVVATALVPATVAAAAAKPVVPLPAQRQIAARAPSLSYVPARVSPPWRYRDWRLAGGVLRVRFASRTEPSKVIVFSARAFHGDCAAGMEKSFQMAGVKTWWSHDAVGQQAWRCVHGRKLVASTTMGVRRYADVGLARIAASGHRIRLS